MTIPICNPDCGRSVSYYQITAQEEPLAAACRARQPKHEYRITFVEVMQWDRNVLQRFFHPITLRITDSTNR